MILLGTERQNNFSFCNVEMDVMKLKLCVFSLFMFLCGISSLYAQHASKDWQAHKKEIEKHKAELDKKLGITSKQKVMMEEIETKHHEKTQDLFLRIEKNKLQLRDLLEQKELNIVQIKKVHEELKLLFLEMFDLRLEMIIAMHSVLTPEQNQLLKEDMAKRFKDHSKKFPPPPPGDMFMDDFGPPPPPPESFDLEKSKKIENSHK